MFYEEIRIKQGLSYILFCQLRILYNSKFIIMATFLGTNAVVVMRVHCIRTILSPEFLKWTLPSLNLDTFFVANRGFRMKSITE